MKNYSFLLLLSIIWPLNTYGQCINSIPDTMGFETADSIEYINYWYHDQDYTDTNIVWWHNDWGGPAFGYWGPYSGKRYLFINELNEDWLISQCYQLNKGKFYELSFQVKVAEPGWSYNLLLKMGANMTSDTNGLIDTVQVFKKFANKFYTGYDYFKFSSIFQVDKDDNYSFGWFFYGDTFDNSYYDKFGIYLDEIIMREYECDSLDIDLGYDKTICFGDTFTCSVNSGYAKYYWNDSLSTDTFFRMTESGTVKLKVVNQYGCVGIDSMIVTAIMIPDDTIIFSGSTTFCKGGSVTAEIQIDNANCSDYKIKWFPGNQTDSIRTLDYQNYYSYIITDKTELCTVYSDTFKIEVIYPYWEQQICLVTVVNGKNKIVWEKEDSTAIDYFIVYRQTPHAGYFYAIDSIPFDSMSTYIDNESDPATRSYYYTISVLDTCGNESDMSYGHQTIHLSMNQGVNGEINLNWTAYEGFSYYTYNIYRDTSPNTSTLYDSVSAMIQNYTDLTPPSGNVYYQVEIVREDPCSPTRSINSSFSNKADKYSSGIKNMGIQKLAVFPNPASGELYIRSNKAGMDVTIFNYMGQLVYAFKSMKGLNEINTSTLSDGIYFIHIRDDKVNWSFIQIIQP